MFRPLGKPNQTIQHCEKATRYADDLEQAGLACTVSSPRGQLDDPSIQLPNYKPSQNPSNKTYCKSNLRGLSTLYHDIGQIPYLGSEFQSIAFEALAHPRLLPSLGPCLTLLSVSHPLLPIPNLITNHDRTDEANTTSSPSLARQLDSFRTHHVGAVA